MVLLKNLTLVCCNCQLKNTNKKVYNKIILSLGKSQKQLETRYFVEQLMSKFLQETKTF